MCSKARKCKKTTLKKKGMVVDLYVFKTLSKSRSKGGLKTVLTKTPFILYVR